MHKTVHLFITVHWIKIEIMSQIKEQEMYQKEIATDLFFLLFQAYDNVESSVRKASVFCMVSIIIFL